tara:strand:+ start:660 stop:1061 length:402 start_codon:yes stop_codon:yes gene_type:complete
LKINKMYFIEFIGRVFLSSLFLVEGIKKLFFFQEETQMYMDEYGVPEILFFPSTFLEIVFPILIIIGLKTRLCASIMAAFTITVALIFHTDFNNQIQLMAFLKDISIAGGFLIVAANENRFFSIDNFLKLKKK